MDSASRPPPAGLPKRQRCHPLLLGLLLGQLSLGSAFADAPLGPKPSENVAYRPIARLLAQVERATTGDERLDLSEAELDPLHMARQDVLLDDGVTVFALNQFDANQTNLPPLDPSFLERTLQASFYGDALLLRYDKSGRTHRIRFPGAKPVSAVWNPFYVYVLFANGALKAIELELLAGLLFQTSVPVLSLGKVSVGPDSPLFEHQSLRVVQSQYRSPDHSSLGEQTSLLADPAHMAKTVEGATPTSFGILEENLERLRPVRLSPYLDKVRASTPPRAGDIAVAWRDGDEWVAEALVDHDDVAERMQPQIEATAALRALADPETAPFVQTLQKLQGRTRDEFEELVANPDAMAAFELTGFRSSLARVPSSALGSFGVRNQTAIGTVEEARKNGLTLRERLPLETQKRAFAAFAATVEAARPVAAGRAGEWRAVSVLRAGFRSFAQSTVERVSWSGIRKGFGRLARIVRTGAIAGAIGASLGAADAGWNEGRGVGLAIDTLGALTSWAQTQMPVLGSGQYMKDLGTSVLGQMSFVGAIFAAAALARPFCQYGINTLISVTGIRFFTRFFQWAPVRTLMKTGGQGPSHRLLREGEFRILPYGKKAREEAIAESSAVVRQRERLRFVAASAALSAASAAFEMSPSVVVAESAGIAWNTADGADDAMQLGQFLFYKMEEISSAEFSAAIDSDPAAFADAYLRALEVAAIARERQVSGEIRSRWARWWSSIGRLRALSKVARFGEATADRLSRIPPDKTLGALIWRSAWVDYVLMVATQAGFGKYAMPAHSGDLLAQPGEFLGTNPVAMSGNAEVLLNSLGPTAMGLLMALGETDRPTPTSYAPAAPRAEGAPAKRGLAHETFEFLKTLFDLRNTKPIGFIARYHLRAHLFMFQSAFLIGWVVRMAIGGASASAGAMGILVELMCATWTYLAAWAWFEVAWTRHERRISQLDARYAQLAASLQQAVFEKDAAATDASAKRLLALYAEGHMSDARAQAIALARGETEDSITHGERMLAEMPRSPPVPEQHREDVALGFTAIVASLSTFLFTFAYPSSFQPRGFFGIDTTQWQLFTGVPSADGLLALGLKTTLATAVFFYGQLGFDVAWDGLRRIFSRAEKGSEEEVRLRERLRVSARTLGRATGLHWMSRSIARLFRSRPPRGPREPMALVLPMFGPPALPDNTPLPSSIGKGCGAHMADSTEIPAATGT